MRTPLRRWALTRCWASRSQWPCGCGVGESGAVPLHQGLQRARAARADDEHLNGAHADSGVDVQEFMILSVPGVPQACAWVPRSTRAAVLRTGPVHQPGRQGGFAPSVGTKVPSTDRGAIGKAGYERDRRRPGAGRGGHRFYSTASTTSGKQLTAAEMADVYAGLVSGTRWSRSRTLDGRLGRLEDPDRHDRRQGAAGGRRPVRHNPQRLAEHRKGWPTRCWSRSTRSALTETLDAVERPTATLHHHDEPPLGRDRGHDHRTWRWPATVARSRPAPRPVRTAWPSTTSSCVSRRCSGMRPATPAPAPSRVSRPDRQAGPGSGHGCGCR